MLASGLLNAWPAVADRLDAAVWAALYGDPADSGDEVILTETSDGNRAYPHGGGSNAVRADALTETGQIDCLVLLERMKSRLDSIALQVLAAMDSADATEEQCVADEVRCALRLSAYAARARLDVARTVARGLPSTLDALETGSITLRHVEVIAEAADRLPPGGGIRLRLEDRVLYRASEQSPAELRRAVTRAVLRLDPDGAQTRHATATLGRRVQRQGADDGMAELTLHAPAADIAAAWTRIDAIARRLGHADGRTIDQRRADSCLDLLLRTSRSAESSPGGGSTDNGDPDSHGPDSDIESTSVASDQDGGLGLGRGRLPRQQGLAPRIEVLVSLSTLLGLDQQPADLAGYGPITADVARDLASHTDATWRRLVTDPLSGALLDYGRTTYRPPADLRDFVLARDAVCAYPHCNMPSRLCQIDHIDAYDPTPAIGVEGETGAGGETSAENTASLCVRNHQGKTRKRWTYARTADGSYRWRNTRTGHTYRSHMPERWNHRDPIDHRNSDTEPRKPTEPVDPPVSAAASRTATDDPPF